MNKLLAFSAHWCAPCQQMKPILDSIENDNLVRVDYDNERDLVVKYQVPGVPCFILVDEEGNEIDMVLGGTSKEVLEELLSR